MSVQQQQQSSAEPGGALLLTLDQKLVRGGRRCPGGRACVGTCEIVCGRGGGGGACAWRRCIYIYIYILVSSLLPHMLRTHKPGGGGWARSRWGCARVCACQGAAGQGWGGHHRVGQAQPHTPWHDGTP